MEICEKLNGQIFHTSCFDMEVYPEWWCLVYSDILDDTIKHVITSDDDDYKVQIKKLKYLTVLIGFNIKAYDLKILNAIEFDCDIHRIYELSKAIINDDSSDKWNSYSFWNKYAFSDLYDDWRMGSLKEFESNSGMDIEETDIPFDRKNLKPFEKELIIKYCIHDVDATLKLFEVRKGYIRAKTTLSDMFKIPMIQTLRNTNAKLAAIILKAKKHSYPDDYDFVLPERTREYVNSNVPKEILENFEILNDENKTFTLFDNEIVFGIGGIHSVLSNNIYAVSTDEWLLINIDVRSYYPNLMMAFNYLSRSVLNPEDYTSIYVTRSDFKVKSESELTEHGKTAKWVIYDTNQTSLKLVLNTAYGAMKNKYNDLYDPYNAGSLCYLGQIMLCGLANKLYNTLNLKVLQTNTDGILVKIYKDDVDAMKKIVSEWESIMRMIMEYDDVKAFYQRDVNNYIEVTTKPNKPYKIKGKWCNQAFGNPKYNPLNAPVTHKAIFDYYVHNTPIRDTIMACDNIFDFCFTAKTGRSYDKTYHFINDEKRTANKVNRVVATTNEKYGTLKKYKTIKDRYDKIAEIPEHCYLMNGELKMIESLDREWYVDFANKKLRDLKHV